MNEEIYEVEEIEQVDGEVISKEPKKPLRVRIGEKLVSNEPLVPKKVKRGIAIALGGLATLGAVAIGFIASHGEGGLEELPEAIDDVDAGEAPFDTMDAVQDAAEITVE